MAVLYIKQSKNINVHQKLRGIHIIKYCGIFVLICNDFQNTPFSARSTTLCIQNVIHYVNNKKYTTYACFYMYR